MALALVLVELALWLASWILNTTSGGEVRSMLGSEGLRWFFHHLCSSMASPPLVWILLAGMAYGCLRRSGLLTINRQKAQSSYRVRIALWSVLLFGLLYLGAVLLMTLLPHAILLSATGRLFPSAFSSSLPAIIAFGAMLLSIVYGIVSGTFRTLETVYGSFLYGLRRAAAWLFFCILIMQIYDTLCYIFLLNPYF